MEINLSFAIFKQVTIGLAFIFLMRTFVSASIPKSPRKGRDGAVDSIELYSRVLWSGLGSPDGSSSAAAAGGGLLLSKQYLGSTEIR